MPTTHSTRMPARAPRCRRSRARRSLAGFVERFPRLRIEPRAQELLDELTAEHESAEVVALSHAEDAASRVSRSVAKALPLPARGRALRARATAHVHRRRAGSRQTIQALATLEADEAFPAAVVCPASMS